MDAPSVSVVIPTFNRVHSCVEAVDSALDQELPPSEILVCDDGSTDETRAYVERWATKESRLRYLRLPRNFGTPAVARNTGVRAARGDWVAFLDDDDRWLPEKLREQAPYLDNGSFDVVASNARLTNDSLYFPPKAEKAEYGRLQLLRDNPIIVSSAVVRRSSLLATPGFAMNRRLASIADYTLWLELADRNARFLVLPQPLVVYESSAEGRLSDSALGDQVAIARHAVRRWLRRPNDSALAQAAALHGGRAVKVALRRRGARREAPRARPPGTPLRSGR